MSCKNYTAYSDIEGYITVIATIKISLAKKELWKKIWQIFFLQNFTKIFLQDVC